MYEIIEGKSFKQESVLIIINLIDGNFNVYFEYWDKERKDLRVIKLNV